MSGSARPRRRVDLRRIEVVEVDRADHVLGDAGGQRDRDPVPLAVDLVPGARAAQVRGVGEVAPVLVLEAVPLLDEVVPAVVADLAIAGCIAAISVMCGA